MKKTVILALALVVVLALTACGGSPSSAAPASSAPAASVAASVPAESTPSASAASTPAGDAGDSGTFEAEGRSYITADALKAELESGADSVFLLDIQLEDAYNTAHLEGAVPTYAFPVENDEQKALVDAVLPDAEGKTLVIVCPGGKGGANNTWDYLTSIDYDMSSVYILENGQNGWPYPELLAA